MKQEFKIGVVRDGQELYNFIGGSKMTISEGINMCKRLFKDNAELENVCLGYDWGDDINIIFTINKDNPNGVLETEAELMVKDEFGIK